MNRLKPNDIYSKRFITNPIYLFLRLKCLFGFHKKTNIISCVVCGFDPENNAIMKKQIKEKYGIQ